MRGRTSRKGAPGVLGACIVILSTARCIGEIVTFPTLLGVPIILFAYALTRSANSSLSLSNISILASLAFSNASRAGDSLSCASSCPMRWYASSSSASSSAASSGDEDEFGDCAMADERWAVLRGEDGSQSASLQS